MNIIPLSTKGANDFVAHHHRHARPVVGAKYALGLMHEGLLVGCVIVGRPVARALDDGFTMEVTRVCVLEDAPKGANSKLYSAAQKVWFAMGGRKLITYTLKEESGASLRGAGWTVEADNHGGQWNHPGRPREKRKIYDKKKLRWAKLPMEKT